MDNILEQLNRTEDTVNKESSSGVYNQFAAPITDDIADPSLKRDKVKVTLIIILIFTILLAIGSFLFTRFLDSQVAKRKQSLETYNNNTSLNVFEENLPGMRSLSQQLKLVNSIYDNKNYISQMLFPIVQSLTESNRDSYVYFDNFSAKRDKSGKFMSVNLGGIAINYPTLYRQINNFKNNPYSAYMTNVKMNSMSLDENGNVKFSASFDIDVSTQAFLKYVSNYINKEINSAVESGPLFKKETVDPKIEEVNKSEEEVKKDENKAVDSKIATSSTNTVNTQSVPIKVISN